MMTDPRTFTYTRPITMLYNCLSEYRAHVEVTTANRDYAVQTRAQVAHIKKNVKNVEVGGEPKPLLDEVRRMTSKMRRQGRKDGTINYYIKTIRASLNLYTYTHLGFMAPRLKNLPTTRKRVEILRGTEQDELMAAAGEVGESELRVIFALAGYAGLRANEILHLRMDDVDMADRWVMVTEKEEIKASVSAAAEPAWTPKSFEERAVPMARKLFNELEPFFYNRGRIVGSSEWMFRVRLKSRRPKRRVSVHSEVVAAFKATGIYDRSRKPGLHQLRRTFASELLAKGADIETVRDLMGHANITTTQIYLGTTDKRRRDALEAMDG